MALDLTLARAQIKQRCYTPVFIKGEVKTESLKINPARPAYIYKLTGFKTWGVRGEPQYLTVECFNALKRELGII